MHIDPEPFYDEEAYDFGAKEREQKEHLEFQRERDERLKRIKKQKFEKLCDPIDHCPSCIQYYLENKIAPEEVGLKTKRRGKYGEFWGCSNWPRCLWNHSLSRRERERFYGTGHN